MTTILTIIFLSFILIKFSKYQSYIPILMYHRIATVQNDRNALPLEKFIEQLEYLNDNNFSTITTKQLYDYYINKIPLPPKAVLLTFDDGYEDNFVNALPYLKKYNMSAIVFPIVNWIGKTNSCESFGKKTTNTMSTAQLKLWLNSGMEICAHSKTHPFLSACSTKQLNSEINDCKKELEQLLEIPITTFCYPYGNFNQKILQEVSCAKYHCAFAIFENASFDKLNILALPRIGISSRQTLTEFKLKVSKFHIIFIILRKIERSFKKQLNKFR